MLNNSEEEEHDIMCQPDYDLAASHWIERDSDSVHMEAVDLKEKIEVFIGAHNT